MKKIISFLYIALILFSVFACTMPSELEITGSPSIKFAVNINFSEYFDEMFDDVLSSGDPKVTVLNCTNSSLKYKTFFIHIEAFRNNDFNYDVTGADHLDDGDEGSIFINGTPILGKIYKISGEKYFVLNDGTEDTVITPSCVPYTVSFNNFGDYLEDFDLTGIKSKMYLSGPGIVDVLYIDLYHISDGNETLISKEKNMSVTNPYKGIDIESPYTDTDLPPGGIEIDISDLINSRGAFELSYRLKLKPKTEIALSWFNDTQDIIVEIAILLPMEFEAAEDDAAIDFSGFLNDISDYLNTAAGNKFIESMNIIIGLRPQNPFGSGIFVIEDEHYSIKSPMDNNSFSFILSNEDLEYINNTEFIPGFSIVYKKGNKLGFLNKDLIMSTISLNAKIKINMEL